MKNWTAQEWARIKQIPASLSAACAALQADHDFLLEGEVFSEAFVEHWVRVKTAEEREFNTHPHPFEVEQYLDC
jgi:glutamine synthetase